MLIRAGLLAAATCLAWTNQAPASAAPPAAGAVDIRANGATPDDDTDDTAAIKKTITEARGTGSDVLIPKGTFRHDDVLHFDGIDVRGSGPASVLLGTNDKRQALRITGGGVAVRDLTLASTATTRGSKLEQHRLLIDKAEDFLVERVAVTGSAAAGIFDYGGRHGVIRNSVVRGTQADGIHHTAASTGVLVEHNLVTATGDDMIAAVSYGTGDDLVANLVIRDNDLLANRAGRGITVVGGQNVTIEDNTIREPAMAGVYIASEESYKSNRVENVTVRDNTIVRAGSFTKCMAEGEGGCGQGALHVFANYRPVKGVRFLHNRVLDSRIYGVHLNGIFGSFRNPQEQDIVFDDNRFIKTGADALFVSASFRGAARFTRNTVWGVAGVGLRYQRPVDGSTLKVSGNVFGDIADPTSAVLIESGQARSVAVTANRHYESSGHRSTYFLKECVDAASESYGGNLSASPSFINDAVTAR